MLRSLHVSHHEAIATGLALILADATLPSSAAVDLIGDALATVRAMAGAATTLRRSCHGMAGWGGVLSTGSHAVLHSCASYDCAHTDMNAGR